jgi:hypothetical protein
MKLAVFFVATTLAAQQYFPSGVLTAKPSDETFVVGWYTQNLAALKEPSLWELSRSDPKAEAYRFLWLRSFDNPITVRLVVTANGGRLIAKRASGKAGFQAGHLILNRETHVSKEAAQWFLDDLKQVDFWKVPAHDDGRRVVLDGAQWIVEGVKEGRYHIIDRLSPDRGDPAHTLGIALMINLARFRLLYQEVY